jgi:hypothetical protein
MKKFATLVFTMLIAGSLAFPQDTGGDKATKGNTGGKKPAIESTTKTKTKSGKKGHKGGKKGKKSSGSTSTPPPK